MPIKFRRTLPLAAALLPALALGGCGGGTVNRGLESVHQPVVERNDFVFDVRAGADGLAPGEPVRLSGWFGAMRLGYGDRVAIDDPAGNPDTAADVAAEVARFGLLLSDEAPVSGAPVAPGTVRVVVSRLRAGVPGCPDFSRYRSSEFEGSTNSNFGCATNSNLAAMVADPGDLVRGDPGRAAFDPRQANKAIDAYRKATPTGNGGTAVRSESTGGK